MSLKWRRGIIVLLSLVGLALVIIHAAPDVTTQVTPPAQVTSNVANSAAGVLETLAVKGRAPKTGYSRDQFGSGWATVNGCDTRNIILYRDLQNASLNDTCEVISGTLHDPYTGKTIEFSRDSSADIQIDHVVALSDSWQTGSQFFTRAQRIQLANDPLELLAVDGPANQQKGDADAATWLPSNKPFRCGYIARQIAIKQKYALWVTSAEKDAMKAVLNTCPGQALPTK